MNNLVNWINSQGSIETPIRLEIGLVKIGNQGMTRYLKIFINGNNVTQMVGTALNLKFSKAKTTNGCVIVKGCGMDMGFWLQRRLYDKARSEGFGYMFDPDNYKYLGRI